MSDTANAFYLPDGDRFVSTDWTIGPWDSSSQHAGPPAALTARAIDALEPGDEMRIARFTFEIFRAIPVAPLRVDARVTRPGKRVQFAEAELRTGDDTLIARAGAWRIRTDEASVPAVGDDPLPFSPPGSAAVLPIYDPGSERSYFRAMEVRFARGAWFEYGPATAWMRMRVALVENEAPSPLTRLLVAADSGNGISSAISFGEYLFINTELTAHLMRHPASEWVALDAVTRIATDGVGHTSTELWDERGRLGAANQSLLVAAR
jgi:hypothetical protein